MYRSKFDAPVIDMGLLSRTSPRSHPLFPSLLPFLSVIAFVSLAIVFIFKVEDYASRTKTVAGHNLDPTPWHPFTPRNFDEESKYARISKIIQCSYLTCPYRGSNGAGASRRNTSRQSGKASEQCPEFFRWIHRDLEPWSHSKISATHLLGAQKFAAFRVVIVKGKLYVDYYYACVQSRAMFTIWGLSQLLKRYPGLIPDVDLMFDCMDKPVISRTGHGSMPLPLFRYCTTPAHFDIPFPDWSFWGWPEVNIGAWDEEFLNIKKGAQTTSWDKKTPYAFWKGNPDVLSPVREALLKCNDTRQWGTEILRQDWVKEAREGYEQSKLSNQCKHRFKIYAEGYAWSVSLKYILSCGSLTLIINPKYEDFFSRGLIPQQNYWPISLTNMCQSIKFAVDWGNTNPFKAEVMGRAGQGLMERVKMDRVYDYMYHLIVEYSKLLDFKPAPPPTAVEVCEHSLLCFAGRKEREFLDKSAASVSGSLPCMNHPADSELINRWINQRRKIIKDVNELEMLQSIKL